MNGIKRGAVVRPFLFCVKVFVWNYIDRRDRHRAWFCQQSKFLAHGCSSQEAEQLDCILLQLAYSPWWAHCQSILFSVALGLEFCIICIICLWRSFIVLVAPSGKLSQVSESEKLAETLLQPYCQDKTQIWGIFRRLLFETLTLDILLCFL